MAQTTAAAKGVVVPVQVTPVVTGTTGAASAAAGLAAAQGQLASSANLSSEALAREQALLARGAVLLDAVAVKEAAVAEAVAGAAAVRKKAAAETVAYERTLGGLGRGAGSAAASLLGVRGATLAATGPFIAGAAAAIAFGKALNLAASFEQQLNVFKVTAGATADEMGRVSDAARELGRDIALPGVSAIDAATAMTELSKAGLSVQDSIDGARGVLQLATAAQIDQAAATEIAAGALNAFGLNGRQAVTVVDLLANASVQAQGSISDMAIALQQSESVARQVGVSINDTVALITLLAQAGLKGSDAGTSLRVAFTRLVNPTAQAAAVLKDLNVQIRDAQGNIRPEVFADFAAAQANLSKRQQDANAAIVFGTDALRAYSIISRAGTGGVDQMRVAVEKQGTAAELAAAQNVGLQGAISNLKNQLETTGQTVGALATGPLSTLVDILAANVQAVNDFTDSLKRIPGQVTTVINLIPHFGGDFGGEDNQQTAVDRFFDGLKGSIQDGAKKALTSTVIERAVPGGQRTLDFLNALFPPDKVKEQSAQAGANLRSGIEDAGRAAVAAANDTGHLIERSLNTMFDLFGTALQQGSQRARQAIFQSITSAQGQQSGLEEALNAILAGGGTPEQQIANLKQQAARQQKIIEEAGDNAAGALLQARRAAQAKLASINQQIVSLQKQQASAQAAAATQAASKQEQAARDAQKARDAADQAVLDSFAPAQNKIDLATIRANSTETLKDDIAVQALIANTASQQIAIVEKSVKDVKLRNQTIAGLVKVLAGAGAELDSLEKQVADAATARQQERAQAITTNLGLAVQLAELRGDDQAEVRALDKAIADGKKRVALAKKAKQGVLAEQIALQQLINQRKELLKTITGAADEEKKGLTAFDLLKQNAETFAQTGGNLITGNQPFAGPTGFTADVAQFLTRGPQPTITLKPGTDPAADARTRQIDVAIQTLIDALNRNTEARGGNSSTAPSGRRGAAASSFYDSRVARGLVESTNP